jgi:drug/metabolite transporter (DMT)-like permease
MKSAKRHYTNSGLVALVLVSAGFGMMPVLAHDLGHGLGLYEQWYLRFGVAFGLSLVLFWRKIRLSKFLTLGRQEWLLLIFRVLMGQIIGLGLFTLASQKAEVGVVSFMQVLPVTPLLGVLLFRERLTWQKTAITLLAFMGAAMTVISSVSSLSHLNAGALLSLLSLIFYSTMLVTRKLHSEHLNNHEITVALMALSCLFTYILSVIFDHRLLIPSSHWNTHFTLVIIAAGALSVPVNFLVSYGFQHVSSVIAGNVLTLEEVFGGLFGYLIYGQVLNGREIVGGSVILVSVIMMNYAIRREDKVADEPIGAID